eukprot:CAMPEP_0118962924 /NCGR_PEP_ID=MMETSP1173-20130426/1070_1 /TAXON_ID=1034831 /ORGANISM="Rhizochromulina marina cf, Strain CCMP1243" /LENGTH=92 /DNA_ID=CAMNT_0006911233 /DNA_START=462 /DNA_END=738 /DNA_ORIENTATION=-
MSERVEMESHTVQATSGVVADPAGPAHHPDPGSAQPNLATRRKARPAASTVGLARPEVGIHPALSANAHTKPESKGVFLPPVPPQGRGSRGH